MKRFHLKFKGSETRLNNVWLYRAIYTGLLQSVIGDTAVPPEEKTGLANACLSLGDYLLWQTDFVDLCQEQAK
jgi:hypothetical protein